MKDISRSFTIISGGQTGADRAGLDAAAYCCFPTGGWAAKGYLTQTYSGQNIADRSLTLFGLKEHPTPGYPARTKANVEDSDGTVWFGYEGSPGGKLTCGTARRLGKPLIINPSTAHDMLVWLKKNEISVLNVAGNRLSEFNPKIYQDTFRVMVRFLQLFAATNLAQ
ncbi:putative molybdenum carrier protein [Leptothoe sp. EHU-05/26/07-4]